MEEAEVLAASLGEPACMPMLLTSYVTLLLRRGKDVMVGVM